MTPQKDTRERLYRMLESGFVHLHEIPKSADRASNKTLYLWSIKYDQLTENIKLDVYKAIKNIKMRLIDHMKSAQPLLDRIEEASQLNSSLLSEADKEQEEKILEGEERLQNSLLHLDNTLMMLEF